MDEDFPDFSTSINQNKYIKTYFNRKTQDIGQINPTPSVPELKSVVEPLTTQNAVKFLLERNLKTKVCRYCLNVTSELSELDQVLQVGGKGALYKVTIKDMVVSFHPYKVADDPNFPNKICDKCLDRTISAYLFAQQCEQAERALHNCFEDIHEKFEKLDPLERPKKRGRKKLNTNHNILYAEHKNVIDYAEPLINIVNINAESMTEEQEITELECNKCWQVLPNVESLLNHEKSHPKSMWYSCRLCGRSFPKCQQLKRHQRSHLRLETKELKPFHCGDCVKAFDSYNEYLQHKENHKFKMVIEHLIERKTNKLCSVCLDKGTKLTALDNTVCLHGPYPELSGDVNLYTIVGTIVPDKKLYKYQELLIPNQANIMKIVRKSKSSGKQRSECIEDTVEATSYNFAKPIIISVGQITIEGFTYSFMGPELIYRPEAALGVIRTSENYDDSITTYENDEFVKEDEVVLESETAYYNETEHLNIIEETKASNAKANFERQNIFRAVSEFTFSNPNLLVLNTKPIIQLSNEPESLEAALPKENISEEKQVLCKYCWIFNKAICEHCVGNHTHNQVTESNVSTVETNIYDKITSKVDNEIVTNTCKICWLFKHVSKCGHCKEQIKKDLEDVAETERMINNKEDTIINRGIDIWQCKVCLTNNTMSGPTCQCCESTEYKDHNKTNFGIRKTELRDTETAEIRIVTEVIHNPDVMNIEDKDQLENETPIEMNTNMDIELTNQDINVLETMDFEEDTNNYVTPNTPALMDSWMPVQEPGEPFGIPHAIPVTNMVFHIGSGDSHRDKGRFRKSLKRMSMAFHK